MFRVRIGGLAQCVLMLDDASMRDSLKITAVPGTRDTFEAEAPALISLAAELADRGVARGEGWALEPNERAACRRAAKSIRKTLEPSQS